MIIRCILSIILLSYLNVSAQPVPADHADSLRPYALVAGGSKGIGYGISEALAKRGYNLILIARHLDTLQTAKTKLEEEFHIHVDVLVMDLAYDSSATAIAKWCLERNIRLKVLCNVAGLG